MQLLYGEGLFQIDIGSALHSLHFRLKGGLGGEQDERYVRVDDVALFTRRQSSMPSITGIITSLTITSIARRQAS